MNWRIAFACLLCGALGTALAANVAWGSRLGLTAASGVVRKAPVVQRLPPRARPAPRPAAAPAPEAKRPPKAAPPPPRAPAADESIGLLELTDRRCRWPVGLATGADQRFCGRTPDHGLTPYCLEHTRQGTGRGSADQPYPNPAREDAAGLPRGLLQQPRGMS